MHYTAGFASLASFSVARSVPDDGWLWHLAHGLLEASGVLFALYLLLALALACVGALWRARDRRADAAGPVGNPGAVGGTEDVAVDVAVGAPSAQDQTVTDGRTGAAPAGATGRR